jgi:gluconate kinase
MDIHKNYNELTEIERSCVDSAFDELAKFFVNNTTIKVDWADGAERVVEAIATWVKDRRN